MSYAIPKSMQGEIAGQFSVDRMVKRGTTYFPRSPIILPGWAKRGSNYTGLGGLAEDFIGTLLSPTVLLQRPTEYSGTAAQKQVVKWVQGKLNEIGSPALKVDGILGPNTGAALKTVLGLGWEAMRWSGILSTLENSHGPFIYPRISKTADSDSQTDYRGQAITGGSKMGMLMPIALVGAAWFLFFRKKGKKGRK